MCTYYLYKDEGLTADLWREPTEELFWEDSELYELDWLAKICRGVCKILPHATRLKLKEPRMVSLPHKPTSVLEWDHRVVVIEQEDGTVLVVTPIEDHEGCGALLGIFETQDHSPYPNNVVSNCRMKLEDAVDPIKIIRFPQDFGGSYPEEKQSTPALS